METSITQLEALASKLSAAVGVLSSHAQTAYFLDDVTDSAGTAGQSAPLDVQHARNEVLGSAAQLQTLLTEPDDFILRIATHHQLLACLQWLGKFQVLAFIPLHSPVALQDVAEVAGVPEAELRRITRMTATAGFLREPRGQPGHIEHTPLSSPFVTKLAFLDAAMFFGDVAAPAALQMAAATQRQMATHHAADTAYCMATGSPETFQAACQQRPRLQRQWPAFLHFLDTASHSMAEVLRQMDWASLGGARVVHACASSPALAEELAEAYPSLRLTVQLCQDEARNEAHGARRATAVASPPWDHGGHRAVPITVSRRVVGSPQPVLDAAVYIVSVPQPLAAAVSASAITGLIVKELRSHLAVLRGNPAAAVVLVARLLPDPGTVELNVEVAARIRDLLLLQLANERGMEEQELEATVNSVEDGTGYLAVVSRHRLPASTIVALRIKYQSRGDYFIA